MSEGILWFLDRHNIPYRTEGDKHTRPGWANAECPFCGIGTGKLHLGFNLVYNYTSCWRCGGHSLWNTFLAMGLPKAEVAEFCKHVKDSLILPGEHVPHRGKYRPPDGLLDELLEVHRQYLLRRDIHPDVAVNTWGVRSVGWASKRHKFRLFIPVVVGETPVSWTTRSIRPLATQRYLSAASRDEAVPHKHLLLGEDMIRSTVLVFEGPFDAMRIGPGATCTFGTAYSPEQVLRIARFPKRYVCFDREPEAQRKQRELVNLLSVLPGETYEVELVAKDASAARKREADELRSLLI